MWEPANSTVRFSITPLAGCELGLRPVCSGRVGGRLSWSTLTLGPRQEWAGVVFSHTGQVDPCPPIAGGCLPSPGGETVTSWVLTWASCRPASVGTCRCSSQSILLPRRRMTAWPRPASCQRRSCSALAVQARPRHAMAMPSLTLPGADGVPSRVSPCPRHTSVLLSWTLSPSAVSLLLLCLQTAHLLSKDKRKGTSSRKHSQIAPNTPFLLPVLDCTGCLRTFPSYFTNNNNNNNF